MYVVALRRLDARRDASAAAVDLERLQLVLVLLEVREAEVAERALVARDALHGDVVVLGRRVVRAARALLTVDDVGEVVERARVGSGSVELERDVRVRGIDLVPVRHLGLGLPDRVQLRDRQARRPVVLEVDDVRQRVGRDAELDVLDAVLLADRRLLLVDRARGIRDVGLPDAEALEAAAGARDADGDVAAAGRLPVLGGLGGERADGARSVGGDQAPTARRVVVATTTDGDESQKRRACEHRENCACSHAASLPPAASRPGSRMVNLW